MKVLRQDYHEIESFEARMRASQRTSSQHDDTVQATALKEKEKNYQVGEEPLYKTTNIVLP